MMDCPPSARSLPSCPAARPPTARSMSAYQAARLRLPRCLSGRTSTRLTLAIPFDLDLSTKAMVRREKYAIEQISTGSKQSMPRE